MTDLQAKQVDLLASLRTMHFRRSGLQPPGYPCYGKAHDIKSPRCQACYREEGCAFMLDRLETRQALIRQVQAALTPDLLRGRWKAQSCPLEGHCYVAAESLWYLLGCDDWKPMCASYVDEGGKATHWWLVHRQTDAIADPTAEQYLPEQPPYHLGKGSGFLTKKPSKRAQVVLTRVASATGNNEKNRIYENENCLHSYPRR